MTGVNPKQRVVLFVESQKHEALRREAFETKTSIAKIVRKLIDQHIEAGKK